MAIIGEYAARIMQIVAAIQSNAAQLGEGNANIAYELGHLHIVPTDQFVRGDVQTIMSKGTTTKIINTNHRRKIRRRRSFSFPCLFPFSLISSLCLLLYA
jgi:hypothetical protein